MIQITDRKDFVDKVAFLIAANTTLLSAGVSLKAPEAETLINQFLDQFEVAPTPPPFEPEGRICGYIIRYKDTKSTRFFNGKGLFTSQWDAAATLSMHVKDESVREGYETVPVRCHV